MAFLAIILEKNAGIKINFLCILLFYEFLMYFFVFLTVCFVVFFGEICGRHFLKHNNAKTNSFLPLRVKISIFIWTMWKNSICIDFVHKVTFWSHFRSDVHVQKLRNFRTVPPGVTNLVSKCAGNLKEKSHKVLRRELCALQSNHAKCRGGPFRPPPPPVFLREGWTPILAQYVSSVIF